MLNEKQAEEMGGKPAVVYQSSVCDYLSDFELEVSMPTQKGRMVLFQAGLSCEFVFYTKRGMYRCIATVKERYKKGNLYLLSVLVKSEPVKFQRREFFRIEYLADVQYYEIPESVAALETTAQLFAEIQGLDYMNETRKGTIQDISGGGARFQTSRQYQKGDYLLMMLQLKNEMVNEVFYLVCQVVSSNAHSVLPGMYSNRVKFIYKELMDREKIVRFVFEEERKIRRKELGEIR